MKTHVLLGSDSYRPSPFFQNECAGAVKKIKKLKNQPLDDSVETARVFLVPRCLCV